VEEEYPKMYLYKRIVQAKLYIDNHFGSEMDLDNIADEACFSKFHFIRLFKAIYDSTPHQYLTRVRIENAKKLLQEGNSINETCFMVGFESVSSFTGLFRRYVHLTPSAFQRQFMEREERIKNIPLQFIPNCFAEQKGWTQKSNFQEAV